MQMRPVGRRALLIEVVAQVAVGPWQATVERLVADGMLAPPTEMVPGARTLLLDGVDVEAVRRLLSAEGPDLDERLRADSSIVSIPVVYDGPDLADVARLWGISEARVKARHQAVVFEVAFCGFAPGFSYMTGLQDEVPRRASPRTVVPAGSVALAGPYCGIYPTASPGGWQLIGTTDVRLFEVDRDPPALLPPGTRVRFVETGSLTERPWGDVRRAAFGRRQLTVVRGGALTTVQDGGRLGLAHLGVPRGGPLDAPAARLANRLVGNDEQAAVLETTVDGCAVEARTSCTVAVTGAVAEVRVDGEAASWGVAVGLPAGSVLDVGAAGQGIRSYVAVAGGITTAAVLGSRSRDTLAGIGPAPLSEGDAVSVGEAQEPPPWVEFSVPAAHHDPVVLRLDLGPRDDWLDASGMQTLRDGTWQVSPQANRIGTRLTGPAVARASDTELPSEGIVLGSVQVPPDGQPVVLLADHPTTGGYPVIGVVERDDLAALAQARPGTAVRFVLSERVRHD